MQPTEAVPRVRPGVGALLGYVSGAVTAAGALGVGVLVGQVLLARMTIPGAEAPPPRSTGRYGRELDGPPLRLAVLGDSTAAGYGVTSREQTPGALLATWLTDAARRPVQLTCPAVVGSVSAWLPGQVETVVEKGVDLAVIFIGANDVTTRASDREAVRHLAAAVRELRAAGAEVVVATCPDLGTIRPILPPLRWLARRWSRQLAEAQTIAVVEAGGRTVALADLLGPQFDAAPETMFGQDRFHPSADGYRLAAGVVLPAALSALGLAPEPAAPTAPLAEAAASAVEAPGRQVTPATSEGLAQVMRHRAVATLVRWRDATVRRTRSTARGVVPSVKMRGAMAPSIVE